MNHLDDLPKRSKTHDTQAASETIFRTAINERGLFVVQREDRNDYGTDVQIEAREGVSMTNIRSHIQLKGTESCANRDDVISIKVARANLNYLLAQPNSIYVCYHVPSKRLLVRYADDVYSEYEHKGVGWTNQDWITVNFIHLFDETFQKSLSKRLLATGKSSRQRRLQFAITPPEKIQNLVHQDSVYIEVPPNPEHAMKILSMLYDAGKDLSIKESFEQFSAVLDSIPGAMDLVYMAEINLGLNQVEIDNNRIKKGIDELMKTMERGGFHTGSLLYSIGNGWLVLGEYQKALDVHHAALEYLDNTDMSEISAQCCKNMGGALEKLGKEIDARQFFERALMFNPYLGEAHFALAMWHHRNNENIYKALEHLDQVTLPNSDSLHFSTIQGWRIEFLFKTGDITGAFREINSLVGYANQFDWVLPWCARQVKNFGKMTVKSARKAIHFWSIFMREFPNDANAEIEYLLCNCYLRMLNEPTNICFEDFKKAVLKLVKYGVSDTAFLWDRIGHWAQADGNWTEAETWYRKAYVQQPGQYGYCLGTTLNFLGRYKEALHILFLQVEQNIPDAMCWFQLAVAREGIGDIDGCITAYQSALELDPDYDLAWFNLGGVYWNSKDNRRATEIWSEAVIRFPNHELTRRLRLGFPFIFDGHNNEIE